MKVNQQLILVWSCCFTAGVIMPIIRRFGANGFFPSFLVGAYVGYILINLGYMYGCIADYRGRIRWAKPYQERYVSDMIAIAITIAIGAVLFILLAKHPLLNSSFSLICGYFIGKYRADCTDLLEYDI